MYRIAISTKSEYEIDCNYFFPTIISKICIYIFNKHEFTQLVKKCILLKQQFTTDLQMKKTPLNRGFFSKD
ncbi:hypothetical protein BSG1_18765 [Bacillus sp. SG-1]|nr:hypothetical protein BSG1_18765 [Bacillus sp. SG-1]